MQIKDEIEDWIVDEVNNYIDDLHDGVKKKTPVRSGRARDGWDKKYLRKLGDTGHVFNEVEYIGYLEDGTVHMAPTHMVARTLIELDNK